MILVPLLSERAGVFSLYSLLTLGLLPIIFISAETDESYIKRAYSLGAAEFIVKPCRMQQLVARLREHLNPDEGQARH